MRCKDCGVDGAPPAGDDAEGGLTLNCGTCGSVLLMLGMTRDGITPPDVNADEMRPWLAFHLGWLGASHSFSPYVRRK